LQNALVSESSALTGRASGRLPARGAFLLRGVRIPPPRERRNQGEKPFFDDCMGLLLSYVELEIESGGHLLIIIKSNSHSIYFSSFAFDLFSRFLLLYILALKPLKGIVVVFIFKEAL
jgi:hypothetical protein